MSIAREAYSHTVKSLRTSVASKHHEVQVIDGCPSGSS
ncbi:MAG: hypothetical protein UX49_C0014G0019, partial [Candidatus Wolfebacteria bacterium GW2011_GWC2_46_275]